MSKFSINKTVYFAKPFDFNMVCELEEMGVSMQDAQKKPLSLMRAYFTLCTGQSKEFAGEQIEAHIANGGSFDDIMSVMTDEMEKSDFFRNLTKSEKEETSTDSQKSRTKKNTEV